MNHTELEKHIDDILAVITAPTYDLSEEMAVMAEEQPAYLAFITQDEVNLLVDEEYLHYYLLMILAWRLRSVDAAIIPDEIADIEEACWGESEMKYWLDDADIPEPLLDALDDVMADTAFVSDVVRLLEVHYITACKVLQAGG